MWIPLTGDTFKPDPIKCRPGFGSGQLLRQPTMQAYALCHLSCDGMHRVQCRHRLLKHHANVGTPDALHGVLVRIDKLTPGQCNSPL